MSIAFSEEELLSLLCLPLFKIPNELSPFYQLQVDQAYQGIDPSNGLTSLEQKGLWSWSARELTLAGREFFVPLFAPTARSFLYASAADENPVQEFYMYEDVIVRYVPGDIRQVTGPYNEMELVEHFRRVLPDRRSPFTENQVSLFENEYIFLCFLLQQQQQEKVIRTTDDLFLNFQKEISRPDSSYSLPVIGQLKRNQVSMNEFDFAECYSTLLSEGFIEFTANGIQVTKELQDFLGLILQTRDLYVLREEMDEQQIFSREASLMSGERGYILGRYVFNSDLNSYIVHLEDIEWHTLYRLINEITRSLDYIEKLLLEVNSRASARILV